MANPTPRRLVPLWAGVAMALLAGGLVAPREVRAGCNHYVVAPSDRLEVFTPTSLDLLVPSPGPAAPTDRPLPCAGLSCSRDPLVPTTPAPAPVRVGEWGCLLASPPADRPDALAVRPEPGPVHPIHFGLSIDRPPRPALV